MSVTNVASTMLQMVINHPMIETMDTSCLRLVSCGGSAQSPAIIERAIARLGCEVFQSYGMTECCGKISMSILDSQYDRPPSMNDLPYIQSCGRPFCVLDLRVVDGPDFYDVPEDGKTVGEVVVAGDTVFEYYTGEVDANTTAFVGPWFKTGDLAVMHPGGYITVVDRAKDMLLVGKQSWHLLLLLHHLCQWS